LVHASAAVRMRLARPLLRPRPEEDHSLDVASSGMEVRRG
jgi:hypothetical protein